MDSLNAMEILGVEHAPIPKDIHLVRPYRANEIESEREVDEKKRSGWHHRARIFLKPEQRENYRRLFWGNIAAHTVDEHKTGMHEIEVGPGRRILGNIVAANVHAP